MSAWFTFTVFTKQFERVKQILFATPTRKNIVSYTAIIAICFSVRNIFWFIHRKLRSYPPGYIGLPLIGSLLSAINIPEMASNMKHKYKSPITMAYLGFTPLVFLHDINVLNQVFGSKFNVITRPDRSHALQSNHVTSKEFALFETNDINLWKIKRQNLQTILVQKLKCDTVNYANNYALNNVINKYINKLIENNDGKWYPFNSINFIIYNSLYYTLFGKFLEKMNSETEQKLEILGKQFIDIYSIEMLTDALHIGFLWNIFPSFWSTYNAIIPLTDFWDELIQRNLGYDDTVYDMNYNEKWNKIFKEKINDDNNNNDNNDIDAITQLLAEHHKNPRADSTKNGILRDICTSWFFAASDTSMNAMHFALILLAKHEDIQNEIYIELYSVFGDDIEMKNKKMKNNIVKLHKLRAFINESLRLSCIVPMGLPRINNKDIWININNQKYCIPSGSNIFEDQFSIHKEDEYWIKETKKYNKKPNEICMDLWFDNDGKFKSNKHKNQFIAFSFGERDCPGKYLALRNIYVLIAKLALLYKCKLYNKKVKIKSSFSTTMTIDPPISLKVSLRKK